MADETDSLRLVLKPEADELKPISNTESCVAFENIRIGTLSAELVHAQFSLSQWNFGLGPLKETAVITFNLVNISKESIDWSFLLVDQFKDTARKRVGLDPKWPEADHFSIRPKDGTLEPDGKVEVTVLYDRAESGDHETLLLLKCPSEHNITLRGQTAHPNELGFQIPIAKAYFPPTSITTLEPTVMNIPIRNCSASKRLRFKVIPLGFKENGYDFDVFSLLDSPTELEPNQVGSIKISFCPIEATCYSARLDIEASNLLADGNSEVYQSYTLGVHGDGCMVANQPADKPVDNPSPLRIIEAGDKGKIFGEKIIAVRNDSSTAVGFDWEIEEREGASIAAHPERGVVGPQATSYSRLTVIGNVKDSLSFKCRFFGNEKTDVLVEQKLVLLPSERDVAVH